MKQVFNWTIGSFFRTIGRTIAFLVMGGIIYYILSSNGFEFGLKDLFFDKVNASSYVSNWIPSAQYKIIGGQYGNAPADNGAFYYFNGNLSATSTTYFYKFGRQFTLPSDAKQMLFNVKINLTQPDTTATTTNSFRCNVHSVYQELGPVDPYETDYEYYVDYFTCNTINSNGETEETKFSITMLYWADNTENSQHPCFPVASAGQNFTFSCPVDIFNINGLVVKIWSNTYSAFNFGLNDMFSIEKDMSGAINNSINSQTQQQQQQHEEVMDSNTTEAEEEATSFFEDFDAPDIGGLGAIITAPLNTIRSLLNSSCTNLVLPLPFVNKNLTLPCMNSIYTEHFGAFFSIYQTIILAIIAYRCIRSIFFDIHGFTNPNDDRIEVMDL